jgi:signal transduction histidine kinase
MKPAAPPSHRPARRSARDHARRGAVATVVVLAVLLHVTTDDQLVADLCYLGVLIGAGVAAWWAAARAPAGEALVPRLVACGVALTASGDVLWALLTRAGVNADVSVADLAWGASYVTIGAAIWAVLGRHQPSGRGDPDLVVDVLTIVVVSVVILWSSSVEVILVNSELSPLVRAVWAAYPVADAVLLALVVRVLASRRTRHSLSGWFAGGLFLWLAADLAYLRWPETSDAGPVMDAAWMLGPVLMAYAMWHPPAPDTRPRDLDDPGVSFLPLLVAVGPLLVPPVLEVLADLNGEPDRPIQLLVSMSALVALAFVRTSRLIRSERSAHREVERARDAALEASEAKSLFLANMGHEIRTPLTTVLAAAEILGDTPLDETQQQLLSRMERCGELLRVLVERILDFSRLAGGRVVLEPTEFDPSALVADVVDAYAERAQVQGLDFDWHLDPRTPATMTADLVRVFQVLTNLLDNAFKFTAQGSVRLEVGPDDTSPDLVRFVVLDTGLGIRDEDQDEIFDVFKQVDGSMTRAHGGSGLGLAICKQLATAMGGSISVRSRYGEGSRFELRLPRAVPQPPPSSPVAADRAGPGHDDVGPDRRHNPSRHEAPRVVADVRRPGSGQRVR